MTGTAPGSAPVDVDGGSPAAQTLVNSLGQSDAYAGVPYSGTAAGNVGLTGVNASDVPVFAMSSYPAQPKSQTSTPATSVEATSEQRSAQAKAVGGGSGPDSGTAGRAVASTLSTCAPDGSVRATADSDVDLVAIAGVLRIGSVRSHATAAVDAAGTRRLTASTEIESASVLGQGVIITDKGIVVAGSTTPTPGNPLDEALRSAGITVRTVTAVKHEAAGEVFAPAVEITVTRDVEGVGTGANTTTHTFGRAYARATSGRGSDRGTTTGGTTTGGGTTSTDGTSAGGTATAGGGQTVGSPAGGGATLPAPGTGAPSSLDQPAVASPGDGGIPLAAPTRLANASLDTIYPSLVVGAAVFLVAWLVFRMLGVKLRWS